MMKLNKKIILAVILIILLIAGAYATENIVKVSGVSSGGIIKVSYNGKVAAYISDQVLEKLMEDDVQDDKLSKGPTLISAVNAAGVGNFREIEVKGTGTNNHITLEKNDVNDNLILYVPGNGKVNLINNKNNTPILININEINIK